jgi:hypothetical protein
MVGIAGIKSCGRCWQGSATPNSRDVGSRDDAVVFGGGGGGGARWTPSQGHVQTFLIVTSTRDCWRCHKSMEVGCGV